MKKNLAKLVREGYLTEEEAEVILSDTRAGKRHESLDSTARLGKKYSINVRSVIVACEVSKYEKSFWES